MEDQRQNTIGQGFFKKNDEFVKHLKELDILLDVHYRVSSTRSAIRSSGSRG